MVDVNFRTYFSIQHLKSAYMMSRESKLIESNYSLSMNAKEKAELNSRNNSYALSSIIACVSFLEATINELICDIVDKENRVNFISDCNKKTIIDAWLKKNSLDRNRVIYKYQFILRTLSCETFDESSSLCQNILTIIEMRNALIHFKPEWNSIYSPFITESENQHLLTEKMQGKFELSVFFKDFGNPFFPNKCIGYGCSKWAIDNVLMFTDEFHRKIGIQPIYDHVREKYV